MDLCDLTHIHDFVIDLCAANIAPDLILHVLSLLCYDLWTIGNTKSEWTNIEKHS
jgi:hypothetical protein